MFNIWIRAVTFCYKGNSLQNLSVSYVIIAMTSYRDNPSIQLIGYVISVLQNTIVVDISETMKLHNIEYARFLSTAITRGFET